MSTDDTLANVVAGRHAVAIDGGYGPFGEHLVAPGNERIDEVWFRGAHCDIAGGSGACWPLADITLDWILDGAVRAGAVLRPESPYAPTATPTELDALTDGARTISLRSLPPNARVHASVGIYLRAHPEYWRRLPAHVVWADMDWLARSERLVRTAAPQRAASRVRCSGQGRVVARRPPSSPANLDALPPEVRGSPLRATRRPSACRLLGMTVITPASGTTSTVTSSIHARTRSCASGFWRSSRTRPRSGGPPKGPRALPA